MQDSSPPGPNNKKAVKYTHEIKHEVVVAGHLMTSRDLLLIKSDATDFLVSGEAVDAAHAWTMAVAQRLNYKLAKANNNTDDST